MCQSLLSNTIESLRDTNYLINMLHHQTIYNNNTNEHVINVVYIYL